MNLENKKVLITGGAGFIGSNLADFLIEKNNEVIVIDNFYSGKKENLNPKAKFFEIDICDFDKIKPLFEGVDYVFHLAAMPRVPISVDDPVGTTNVNITGTVSVFKASLENKVKRVVFASSSSVYGNQEKLPLYESMTPMPISPYALQKLAGEYFAKIFTDLYGQKVVSLRFFNIYGPRLDPNSEYSLVIGKFLNQLNSNKPITIFGDGNQTRGFCYIDDLVDALIKAATSGKIKGGEIINIGSEKSHSVNYLADLLGGQKVYLPPRAGDVLHTMADISLAKELIDWQPKVPFEEGVKKTQEWFNKYKV